LFFYFPTSTAPPSDEHSDTARPMKK